MPSYIQKAKPPISAAVEMGGFVLVGRSQTLVTQKASAATRFKESLNS